jgi:hypothetical protein
MEYQHMKSAMKHAKPSFGQPGLQALTLAECGALVGGYAAESGGNGGGSTSGAPAAPASAGLFGYSFTETLAGIAAGTALAGGLGQGVGASVAIEAAGGLSGLGAAASGVGGSIAIGLASAAIAGGLAGTLIYNNSETVRDGAAAVVEGVMNGIHSVSNGVKQFETWVGDLPYQGVRDMGFGTAVGGMDVGGYSGSSYGGGVADEVTHMLA